MAKDTPTVRDGILKIQAPTGQLLSVIVDSPEWFAWLDHASSFVFDSLPAHFTARKKWRRRRAYWYIQLRRAGKLSEAYLGKSAAITMEKLRTVVERLGSAAQTAVGWENRAGKLGKRDESVFVVPIGQDAQYGEDARYILRLVEAKTSVPPTVGKWITPAYAYSLLSNATTRRLTILEAPAGYGKTTLLARWIAASGVAAAWVTLDVGHNDETRFWTHVGAALDKIRPGALNQLLPYVPGSNARQPQALVEELVSCLAGTPNPTMLVLDDFHEIHDDNTALLDQSRYLFDHAPPQAHFVIATRERAPFPLAYMRAEGQLLELTAGDLAFTRSEMAALLAQHYSLDLSADEIAEMYHRTQGWPIAITMAAQAHTHTPARRGLRGPDFTQDRFVSEFVVEEVLRLLPDDLQAYLLRVSLLDRLCARLCDAVTQRHDGQAMLEELLRRDLFILPLDAHGEWYRFHPLFAQALKRRLTETQGELVRELYARASEWCRANRFIRDATEYAFAGNHIERAADLIERHIPDAWRRGRVVTLRRFIERLPGELVRQRPRLLLAYANTLILMRDRARLPELLREAEEALARTDGALDPAELAGLRSELAVQRIYAQSNPSESTAQDRIETYETALTTLSPADVTRDLVTVGLGIERLLAGDVRVARAKLADLLATTQAWGYSVDYASCLLFLGQANLQSGLLEEVLDLGKRGFQVVAQAGVGGDALSLVNDVLQGYVLYERNDLKAAIARLAALIESASPLPPAVKLAGLPLLAFALHAQGNDAAARAAMENVSGAWEQSQDFAPGPWALGRRLIAAERARLWVMQGEIALASDWARRLVLTRLADMQSEKGSAVPSYVGELESMALARVHVAEGNPREALAVLDPLAVAAEAAGRVGRLIEMLILQALARHALQDQDAAHHALARAVVLGAPERFTRTFVDAGPIVKLLLSELASLVATHQLTSLLTPHATPSGPARTAEETAVLDYIHRLIAAFGPPLPAAQGALEEGAASGGNVLAGAATERSVASAHGRRRTSHPDRAEAPVNQPLSPREIEVIHALARGAKNQVIAAELSITEPTVKRHVTHILAKLRARNRTQAVVTAIALGLIEPEITQFAESAEMRL